MDMLVTENKISVSNFINSLVSSAIPFAAYRLPQQENYHLILSEKGFQAIGQVDFESLNAGFVFAPFSRNYSKPLFIDAQADLVLDFDTENINISGLDCYLEINATSNLTKGFELNQESELENSDRYVGQVERVIGRIKQGEARKVVFSRKKKLGKLSGDNFFLAFKRLCKSYDNAMVSLVNLPSLNQIWMGASPEVLVSQDKEKLFKTMSLAGTQAAFDKDGNEIAAEEALWSQKEIEEQAIVSRYIINCLKTIRVRDFEEDGPRTVKAGKLLHLMTSYKIDNKKVDFPNLSSVMLDLLHPTPAICGMPKDKAEEIINETEDYNREFFSGYLGPVNIAEESHLFVNLRTIKVENGWVYSFAGGGITADSKPLKEWNETIIKMATVCRAFENS